jgi:MFS family permease
VTLAAISNEAAHGAQISWTGRSALLLAAFCPVLAMYGFGVALPPIAAAFADRPHALLLSQLVGGIVALAFAVGSPPVGRLIDRFGYRSVLLVSIIAFSFAGAAGGLMSNLYAILVTRVLLGFTVAGVLVSAFVGIGDLSARDRVRMYGFQGFVGGVLAICTFPAVGWAASLGWRWPFAIHLCALLIVPLVLGVPDNRRTSFAKAAETEPRRRLAGLAASFLIVAFVTGMAGVIGSLFSPFLLIAIGVTDPKEQSVPLLTMAVAALVASGSFGWVRPVLGRNGTFAAAIATLGLGLLVAAMADSLAGITVGLSLSAIGMSAYTPNVNAAAVAMGGSNPGRALGLANGVLYGAQGLFPFVASGISTLSGPKAVFASFGCCTLGIGIAYGVAAIAHRGKIA